MTLTLDERVSNLTARVDQLESELSLESKVVTFLWVTILALAFLLVRKSRG